MKFVKSFEKFLESFSDTEVAPSKPITKPDVKPGVRPQKPSPIKRDKPSVEPDPKAKLKKSSAEEVAEKFINLMVDSNEDVKKYAKTI